LYHRTSDKFFTIDEVLKSIPAISELHDSKFELRVDQSLIQHHSKDEKYQKLDWRLNQITMKDADIEKLILKNDNVTTVKNESELSELLTSMENIMIEDYMNFINKYKFACFLFSKQFDANVWVKLLICCSSVKF